MTRALYRNTSRDAWGLRKEARLRLWPAGSPLTIARRPRGPRYANDEGADDQVQQWLGPGGLARLEGGAWSTDTVGSGIPGNEVTNLVGTSGPGGRLRLKPRGDGGETGRSHPVGPRARWGG